MHIDIGYHHNSQHGTQIIAMANCYDTYLRYRTLNGEHPEEMTTKETKQSATTMGQCQTNPSHIVQTDAGNDNEIVTMKPTIETSSAEDDETEEASLKAPAPAQSSSLSIFHEDILLAILSYIADVPFEKVENNGEWNNSDATINLKVTHNLFGICGKRTTSAPTGRQMIRSHHSTLTHTLPFVSKQFHKLTRQYDLHWKHALLRLVKKDPTVWEEGMKRTIFNAKCDELRAEIKERNRSQATRRRDKRTRDGQLNQPPHPFESKIIFASVSNSEHPNVGSSNDTATAPPLVPNKEQILQLACTAIQSHPPHHHPRNRTATTPPGKFLNLYQSIVLHHMRYKAPVFCMPSRIRLGNTYGLHLFEPRYRILISEVMSSYPVSARRGEPVLPVVPGLFPPTGQIAMADDIKVSILNLLEESDSLLEEYQLPTFIHAHQTPMRPGTPAAIVQVQQCVVHPNGSADVFLKPLSYVILEEMWERPGTGGLVEARGVRMGKEAGESFERWCGMRGFGMGDGRGRGQMLPIP